jgi:hypothetical protein
MDNEDFFDKEDIDRYLKKNQKLKYCMVCCHELTKSEGVMYNIYTICKNPKCMLYLK